VVDRKGIIVALTSSVGALASMDASAWAQATVTLPTIEVVESHLFRLGPRSRQNPGKRSDRPAADFDQRVAPSLVDGMIRALPGVSRSDQTGNPFQPDIDYRGFTASPVPGTRSRASRLSERGPHQ
jgi:iron complex outermembrane receptor protein